MGISHCTRAFGPFGVLLTAFLLTGGSPLAAQQEPVEEAPTTAETPPTATRPYFVELLQDPAFRPYDPNQNMAPDGTTVIAPDLPDDLPNPDRWRYVPGGRIKPGNPFERFLVTTFITPIFFREQDIGFGGGVAVTDIDFRNQDWREFANIVASYSEEGQQAFRFNWRRWIHHRPIAEGGIIRDERSRWGIDAAYSRTLTRRFFGLEGSSSLPNGESQASGETSYTEDFFVLGAFVDFSYPDPGDPLRLRIGGRIETHNLQEGRVEDVPSTSDPESTISGQGGFRRLFEKAEDVQQLWLTGSVAWDTRDSVANPYRGVRVGLTVDAAVAQSGYAPAVVTSVDTSGAITVPPLFHDGAYPGERNPPTDVLAYAGFLSHTSGDLPFYSLPSLGGDQTLRGYIQNRFTGETAAHGSVEYRFAVIPRGIRFTETIRLERVSLAAFYDFGWVSDDIGDLGSNYLDSYGMGLRLGLARDAVFRVDLGFSKEDSNLTVSFGNPF